MGPISKVSRGERARIERLLAWAESRIRTAFRRFFDAVRSGPVRRQVRAALEREGIEAALRVVDAHVARVGDVLVDIFQRAGREEAAALVRKLPARGARVAIAFDPTHQRAADLIRRSRLEFIEDMTRAQRRATLNALSDALRTGAGPAKTAAAFHRSIGLTDRQQEAVDNYRQLLEASDKTALTRDLRDRRFDRSVRRAAAGDVVLGREKIDRMVDRYRDRYLRYRAETIARTETLRAVGRVRREALGQVLEEAEIPRGAAVRVWASTRDARVRDPHAAMDGQRRGIDEPYESPYGSRLMFPGDSSLGAPAEEVVNCRCTEYFEILDSE